VLDVRGLTKRFGGFTAVSGVSFSLAEGEILGLIGPNGSGKSTTFNLIAGLYEPSAGSVRLAGEEIGGLIPAAICRKGIARTFQIPRPFRRLSLVDNVAIAAFYGKPGALSRERAYAVAAETLELVQLPTGADARVDGLDEAEMNQAADMLAAIRRERNVTIIWVEHIMGALMRVVDRCLVLDHGEVIAEGKPEEVAHDPRVIEVYLGTDAADVQKTVAGRAA
jgi:branched-chain amino acid transport system ATP-binding protein